jgi:CHASE3 domain sensor protein
MSSPATPARASVQGWSTPTILRVCLVSIWLADAIFLSAVIGGARTHRDATRTVGRDTAPSIIAAEHIKSAMAGMDASEARELLGKAGQMETTVETYEARRLEASKALIAAAGNITYGDAERDPIQRLEIGLGDYGERAQRARDLRDKGDPHFLDAYRQAAELADRQLYPAADALDKANRVHLDDIYDGQKRGSILTRTGVVIAGLLLLFVLLSVQSFLNRRMRRVFNLSLLSATLIAFWLLSYSVGQFNEDMRQLKIAKQDAFESIHTLWRARAVAYEANAEESRYLLDADRADLHDQAFFTKSKDITDKYIDAELHNITFPGEQEAANDTAKSFDDFLKLDKEIRRLKQTGKRDAAVALCLGFDQGQAQWAFHRFDEALGRTLEINQSAFDKAVVHAEKTLENFQAKAIAACLGIAILALAGLLSRIQEYR